MTTHRRIAPFAAAGLAALLLALAGALPACAAGFGNLILQKDSLYHRIFVYKDGPLMTLQFGRMRTDVVQSQVDLSDLRRNMHEYTQLSFCGLLYKSDPKRMLVVGLGGGVIPREMHHYFPDMQIDVAEIDPDIPPIAGEVLRLQDRRQAEGHRRRRPHVHPQGPAPEAGAQVRLHRPGRLHLRLHPLPPDDEGVPGGGQGRAGGRRRGGGQHLLQQQAGRRGAEDLPGRLRPLPGLHGRLLGQRHAGLAGQVGARADGRAGRCSAPVR